MLRMSSACDAVRAGNALTTGGGGSCVRRVRVGGSRDGIYTCPQPSACTAIGSDAGFDCPLRDCSECTDGQTDCADCYLGGHAVTIIGWGWADSANASSSAPYWIVKNSWGKHWGEEGVFRISADYASNCNLLVDCSDAARTDCVWGINVNNPMGLVPPSAAPPPAGASVSAPADTDAEAMSSKEAVLASRASRASAAAPAPSVPPAEKRERVLASVTCGLSALRCVCCVVCVCVCGVRRARRAKCVPYLPSKAR